MIRVLLVEDSATVRRHLTSLFTQSGHFMVVDAIDNGNDIVNAVRTHRPDLVSLDVFLPGPSAAEIVRRIRTVSQVPIMLLSDAPRNASEVFDALAAGALEVHQKPKEAAAAQVMLEAMRSACADVAASQKTQQTMGVVVIGSSAGGPAALRSLLSALPAEFPVPVLVAQHLAQGFEPGLASWLSQATACSVRVAGKVEPLQPGVVLLGPSGCDLVIRSRRHVEVQVAPALGYHPSATALFQSAVTHFGAATVAVVLSGVGHDGSQGAAAVSASGGQVLTQNRATSAVFGMPRAAQEYASLVGSPEVLAASLLEFARLVS